MGIDVLGLEPNSDKKVSLKGFRNKVEIAKDTTLEDIFGKNSSIFAVVYPVDGRKHTTAYTNKEPENPPGRKVAVVREPNEDQTRFEESIIINGAQECHPVMDGSDIPEYRER